MELGKNLCSVSEFSKKTLEKYDVPFPVVLAERHPHIVNNIALFWGCRDFPDYMENLIVNAQTSDRIQRQGFLPDAFKEILTLTNLHNNRFPQYQKISRHDPYGL